MNMTMTESTITEKLTFLLGIVFVVVGIAGFVGGGHHHSLILFGVNTNHNAVHIVSGFLAMIAARAGYTSARIFCIVFGITYGLVTIGGFLGAASISNALNLNMADNWLHLIVSVAFLYLGFKSKI